MAMLIRQINTNGNESFICHTNGQSVSWEELEWVVDWIKMIQAEVLVSGRFVITAHKLIH